MGTLQNDRNPGLHTRNSSIELLKVIGIVLIVVCHAVQTMGNLIDLETATIDFQVLALVALRYNGILGNTLFFVCSAWFLLDSSKWNLKKEIAMLLDIWVISLGICAVALVLRKGALPPKMLLRSLFPNVFQNNWYLTCYLLFYPIHPWLNRLIAAMPQRVLLRAAVGMGILYIGCNYLADMFFSSSLILWVTVYFVVAYMKFYLPVISAKAKWNWIGLGIGLMGNLGIILLTDLLGLRIPFFSDKLLHWNKSCSPFLLLASLSSLDLARRVTFTNRAVNYVSSLSLLVYLFHENLLVRSYCRPALWEAAVSRYGEGLLLPITLVLAAGLYLFGFACSALYAATVQRLTRRIAEPVADGLKKRWGKLEQALLRLH